MVGRISSCLLLLCALLAVPSVSVAQPTDVRATVDRATIRENESFTFTLRVEGAMRDEPDFRPLTQDFDILQRATSTSVRIVAGRTTRLSEWVLQLMPRRTGALTVPALELSGIHTQPLEITVLSAPASPAQGDVFVEVEVDTETPYVQSQVIYTLRLYAAVGTGRTTLTIPQISQGDAIIERITDDREYETVVERRRFWVRERRYVVFPQSPGIVTIAPVTLEALTMPSGGRSRIQRARSPEVELHVRGPVPPPPEWQGARWLPASALTLTEHWSDASADITVGTPVTRTITIEADGLEELQLPELAVAAVDGLRHFPGQPELARSYVETGLRASRRQPYAVLAQTVGVVQLPAVELPWWNTSEHRWEVARLPARERRVLPAIESETPEVAADITQPVAPARSVSIWPWISSALLLGWVISLLWLLRWQRSAAGERARGMILVPRSMASRRALRRLRDACAAHEAGQARELLLAYAQLRFDDHPPRTLADIALRVPAELAAAIAELEADRYGPAVGPWNGDRLGRALALFDSAADVVKPGRKDPLLPLYR